MSTTGAGTRASIWSSMNGSDSGDWRWGDAPAAVPLFGRKNDDLFLTTAVDRGARVVAVTGAGGLGKSVLARVWAEGQRQSFEQIVWIGFKNRVELLDAFQYVRQIASPDALMPSRPLHGQLEDVVALLNGRRLLLIFDNLESVMDAGAIGSLRPDYAALETLINRIAEVDGEGVLVLTSREVPAIVSSLSKQTPRLAHRPLAGLKDLAAVREFLAARGFSHCEDKDALTFAAHHDGNPYAMGLATDYIAHQFKGGGLRAYVEKGCPLPSGVTELLAAQYERLSPLEQLCLARLAVERVGRHVDDLVDDFGFRYAEAKVKAAFSGLQARSLLEPPTEDGSTLQNLLMEFMTGRVVAGLVEDLETFNADTVKQNLLVTVPVLNPQVPAHVRSAQVRTIVEPILEELDLRWGGRKETIRRLDNLIDGVKGRTPHQLGYASGTVVNLFLRTGASLAQRSLAGLPLWNCDFSPCELHGVDMSGCDLRGSGFRTVLGGVVGVCFDEKGLRLSAGTADGLIHSWDTATWQHRSAVAHEGFTRAITYDAKRKRLVTVGDDRWVRAWDPETLRHLPAIEQAGERLRCVSAHPSDGTVAWGGEKGLLQVKKPECAAALSLEGHELTVRGLTFRAGQLVSVCEGGLIVDTSLEDPGKGRRSRNLDEPLWCVAAVDDSRLVVGGRSGTATVLDANLQPEKPKLPSVRAPIWQLAVVENWIAAATSAGTLVLYDLQTGSIARTIPLHGNWARALAVHAARGLVATGGEDHAIHVMRTTDWTPRRSLLGASQSLWAVRALVDNVIVAGGSDGVLHVWESGHKRTVDLGGSRSWVRALAVSPDGWTVAVAGDAGEILLWDGRTGAIRRLGGHSKGEVWSLDFHPRRPLLASAGEDRTVRVWSTTHRASSDTVIHEHASWVVSVRFDPTGTLIASGADDGKVLVTDIDGNEPVWLSAEGSLQPWALAWVARTLFAGGRDGHVREWWLDNASAPRRTIDWGAPIWSLAADSSSLFVTGDSGRMSELRVQDLSRAREDRQVGTARNHDICITRDERRLLVAGDDGVVREVSRQGDRRDVLVPDRQYEGLRLAGAVGISPEEVASLLHLGATLDPVPPEESTRVSPGVEQDDFRARKRIVDSAQPSTWRPVLLSVMFGILLLVALIVVLVVLKQ